eukprot:CAMPEP_0195528164 /NCGR_PEP_ID=MMETSP0794_2-20130614/30200_1 /TAXON_ID=515487 /ORGANISM="Stephanopyxis turris, Strain CCMP 815" /LENGTH=1436 /DNA_ID=CAMNT_0040659245 /DNA_START=64 /DNA_END=4374 /DNA_ORIENTATION=-
MAITQGINQEEGENILRVNENAEVVRGRSVDRREGATTGSATGLATGLVTGLTTGSATENGTIIDTDTAIDCSNELHDIDIYVLTAEQNERMSMDINSSNGGTTSTSMSWYRVVSSEVRRFSKTSPVSLLQSWIIDFTKTSAYSSKGEEELRKVFKMWVFGGSDNLSSINSVNEIMDTSDSLAFLGICTEFENERNRKSLLLVKSPRGMPYTSTDLRQWISSCTIEKEPIVIGNDASTSVADNSSSAHEANSIVGKDEGMMPRADINEDKVRDASLSQGNGLEEQKHQLDDLFPEQDSSGVQSSPNPQFFDSDGIAKPSLLLLPSSTSPTGGSSPLPGGRVSFSSGLALVSLDNNVTSSTHDDTKLNYSDESDANSDSAAVTDDNLNDDNDLDDDQNILNPVSSTNHYRKQNLALTDVEPSRKKIRRKGRCGLGNLGNTCFLNSTLQCLAHTDSLRTYFVSGSYKQDLNRDNPLGTGGELAIKFAELLQQMWGTGEVSTNNNSLYNNGNSGSSYGSSSYGLGGGSDDVVYPRNFKYALGRHAEQFMGYDQHDSQELATYLLDALHEDTNRVTKKPYIEKPEQLQSETDEIASSKAWKLHLQREDSRVLQAFMGQTKSKVTCPEENCCRESTTFDPFMYLSVPIPGATDRSITVTVVPLDPTKRLTKVTVTVSKTSTIASLAEKVAQKLSINKEDLCFADLWNNEVYTYIPLTDEVSKIRENDDTYAFELASVDSIHKEESDFSSKAIKSHNHAHLIGDDSVTETESLTDSCDETEQDETQVGEGLGIVTKMKLERSDDEWMKALRGYTKQTLLSNLLSKKSTHHERMDFCSKLGKFIRQCKKCPDAHLDTPSTCKHQVSDDENEVNDNSPSQTTPDDDLSMTCGGDLPTNSVAHQQALTLQETSQLSSTFINIDTFHDLLVLEVCAKKFRQHTLRLLKEKEETYKDGILIQVMFKRGGSRYYSASRTSHSHTNSHSGDRNFTIPLVMRISPRLTVHELRKLISHRLSRAIVSGKKEMDGSGENSIMDDTRQSDVNPGISIGHRHIQVKTNGCNVEHSSNSPAEPMASASHGEPSDLPFSSVITDSMETFVMEQIPMTYQRKRHMYASHSASHQLGSLETHSRVGLASPTEESEKEYVAETVGKLGSVSLHWPLSLAEECFDETEWESTESLDSSESKDTSFELDGTKAKKKNTISVLDCVEKYCKTEQLDETEMWYCNRCKNHVRAWKEVHLYRAPPILIIHLKRFHYSSITHRRDKIDIHVDFPTTGLDLTEYVLHWNEGEEPIYDCYAVSNHYGGLGGGHYTAYANNNGQWCHFDDSRVTEGVDEEEVVSRAAYVLYYRRRDVQDCEGNGNSCSNSTVQTTSSSASLSSSSFAVSPSNKQLHLNKVEEMEVDAEVSSPSTCVSPMDSIDVEAMFPDPDADDSIVERDNYHGEFV